MVANLKTMPVLPKALVADDTYTDEDAGCTLIAEYVIHSYGTADDAPDVEVIALLADFGGCHPVTVPLSDISGRRLLEIEAAIAWDVEVNHRASAEDARNER
jgi:hypothetical protein